MMEKQVTTNRKEIEKSVKFDQVIERGCGMDIHQDTLVVTIQGKDIPPTTKTYRTYTTDLQEMKGWLKENKVSHVAMESTGV
jgi:transposase